MSIVEKRDATNAATDVLDAEHSLFTDAIALALDRGDVASAFAFAERSRGATLTIAELQQRLAGSETVVLEIVALPRELLTLAIAENDSLVVRKPRRIETLAALADEALSETGTTAAATLYDDVIRPVDAVIAHARELVIVADAHLQSVPFAALYDRVQQRYLIERFAVSLAASAGSLQRDGSRVAAPLLAVIALPSGGAESKALPEAQHEVRDVASLYAHSQSIDANDATLAMLTKVARIADVIHISGHTEQQHGGGEQALLFAGARGDVERVSWKTIVTSQPVRHGIVVLAACETLRSPASSATRALSLGAAFSAAGASDVIGTLAPIGDRDARELFAALHRGLASGVRPADALRAAQLKAMVREKTDGGRRAWRSVALLTRRTSAPLH
jgi:CHAT domain-containing protein